MYKKPYNADTKLRRDIRNNYLAVEDYAVKQLFNELAYDKKQNKEIEQIAKSLVTTIRSRESKKGFVNNFLQEFSLNTEEGVILMCLAEALLRIPDNATMDNLIRDKLSKGNWQTYFGKSPSFLVNATTWGMMLTGNWVKISSSSNKAHAVLKKLITRSGEPAIRLIVIKAIKIISNQFVLAQTISEAMEESVNNKAIGFNYSYDMLGESAQNAQDAKKYYNAYFDAIKHLTTPANTNDILLNHGISIKLSALHPRYELAKTKRVQTELYSRLLNLVKLAKSANIGVNIDAEEADKLELSLALFEKLAFESCLNNWQGLGFVVQAYQKRASYVIKLLAEIAKKSNHRLMVRLVKGAYWDSEIKKAQINGLDGFPVFTKKENTDLSYLVCAKKLLAMPEFFYPQFATHNARTVAEIMYYAKNNNYDSFEFQCLHGMGESLYLQIIKHYNYRCRIYAPVGKYKYLLAYLSRRLLENGANTSFINLLANKKLPIIDLIANPIDKIISNKEHTHPNIALGSNIYGTLRKNSIGVNLEDCSFLDDYYGYVAKNNNKKWHAKAIIAKDILSDIKEQEIFNPAKTNQVIGTQELASKLQIDIAINYAQSFSHTWDNTALYQRKDILDKAAQLYENNLFELTYLCQKEAGKVLSDAISEVREAVDFLRYYGEQACANFNGVSIMPGPTGECNEYKLCGRGVFVCISPWNFPLAIFTGQLAAALITGNTVIVKPAIQTPLIAYRAVELLHAAGVPKKALQLLLGDGGFVGNSLVSDNRVSGVAFTGSVDSSRTIVSTLLNRKNAPLPHLIAETGGINAMIVDSSALIEQVTQDVIRSAFQSAGQRCSALRVLYIQEDIADKCLDMIAGAMAELKVGNPISFDTDVGPIIDLQSLKKLQTHINFYEKKTKIVKTPTNYDCDGNYFAPVIIYINTIYELKTEVFGPVLHIIKFRANNLENVIKDINTIGYGLTLGIHSRIDSTISFISKYAKVGNIYVNRDMIGAVVGVQPFGGCGLSGTGLKAGGPNYLTRFAMEKTISTNTSAIGGDYNLINLR